MSEIGQGFPAPSVLPGWVLFAAAFALVIATAVMIGLGVLAFA